MATTSSPAGRLAFPAAPAAALSPPSRPGVTRGGGAWAGSHVRDSPGQAGVAARQVGVVAVGGGGVMAVETLSPDWEFDRVDDGSQSKRARGQGLRAARPGRALEGGSRRSGRVPALSAARVGAGARRRDAGRGPRLRAGTRGPCGACDTGATGPRPGAQPLPASPPALARARPGFLFRFPVFFFAPQTNFWKF